MSEKLKVLLVDEQSEQRNAYTERLSFTGYDVIGATGNPRRALEIISEEKPDVVLFDIVLSPIDGITFLKEAISLNLEKKPRFIAVSSIMSDAVVREAMQTGADYFMIKPCEFQVLKDRIDMLSNTILAEENDSHQISSLGTYVGENQHKNPAYSTVLYDEEDETPDIENQVTELILQIGIPAHIKGYHFVRSAIIMAVESPDTINAITKIVYPTIAKMYQTSPSRVERAIRHAIEVAWDRGDVDTLNSIFGYSINSNKGKPTNSEFIAMLSDKLRLKNKQYTYMQIKM